MPGKPHPFSVPARDAELYASLKVAAQQDTMSAVSGAVRDYGGTAATDIEVFLARIAAGAVRTRHKVVAGAWCGESGNRAAVYRFAVASEQVALPPISSLAADIMR